MARAAAPAPARVSADGARAVALRRIATVRTEARIPGLVAALTRADAAVLVLKGPVTRRRLYGTSEERPTADVDLLVPPRSFRAAGRALADQRYVRVVRGGHSDVFAGPGGVVDLHLALPFTTTTPGRAFVRLQAHVTTMEVAGHRVPVLDEPAHVVHLALHAAQNGFDPAHRSLEEWHRGWAGLSARDRAIAELVVDQLGAAQTWVLARLALDRPDHRAQLAEALPTRWLVPTLPGTWAFANSPIPARVQWRVLRAHVRGQLSDDRLAGWRDRAGLAPVDSGTSAGRWAKVRCLGARTGAALRGRHA